MNQSVIGHCYTDLEWQLVSTAEKTKGLDGHQSEASRLDNKGLHTQQWLDLG